MFQQPRSITLGLALSLAVALPALADRAVSERLDVDPNDSIEINNVAGSIIVRGWNRDEVSVEGTVGDDVEAVTVESRGSRIVVDVELPRETSRRRRELSADLEIMVPMTSRIEASTVSASQSASDLMGIVELETVSGSIELEGRPESVDVSSVSGTVMIDVETETVDASTVSGKLELRGTIRSVKASSVSGRIDLGTEGSEEVDVESVSAPIVIDHALSAAPDLSASSHSGSITLRLDRDASAEIDASSQSGRITNDLGPAAEERRYGSGASLSFTLGRGDGRIDLETFSGSVRIEER